MKRLTTPSQLILFAGFVLWLVLNSQQLWSGFGGLISVLSPILTGAVLAFVLNIPTR